jgi:hypothetical protein
MDCILLSCTAAHQSPTGSIVTQSSSRIASSSFSLHEKQDTDVCLSLFQDKAQRVWQLFQEGRSIDDIGISLSYPSSTVLAQLCEAVNIGLSVDILRCGITSQTIEVCLLFVFTWPNCLTDQKAVLKEAQEQGLFGSSFDTASLQSIKKSLPNVVVDYGQIRLILSVEHQRRKQQKTIVLSPHFSPTVSPASRAATTSDPTFVPKRMKDH